jgi:hypothetical protein
MDNDPWKNVFDAINDSSIRPLVSDIDLTPLNHMRRQLGEAYSCEAVEPPFVPQLGESYGDDTAFECILRDSVEEILGREPLILYNPGSGEHLALAHAFPQARTIFVDGSGDVEHVFIQHNIDHPDTPYEFYRANMHAFRLPDNLKADVTLILNAGYMTQGELTNVVLKGGLVIVNNWHGAASYMQENCDGYDMIKKVDLSEAVNDLYIFRRIH